MKCPSQTRVKQKKVETEKKTANELIVRVRTGVQMLFPEVYIYITCINYFDVT